MLKRYCDCCGKELEGTWYNLYPQARDDSQNGCKTESACVSIANMFSIKKDYCKECVDRAMKTLEK